MPLALTLGLAVAGALGAGALGLPLANLLGPLVAVMAATFAGLPVVRPPGWMVTPMRVLLGVSIGAAFSVETLGSLASSGLALLAVPVYALVATLIGLAVYVRMGRYSRAEAFFSSLPGGIYTMTSYAEDLGIDIRRIALAHGMRVMMIVLLVPPLLWAFGVEAEGQVPATARPLAEIAATQHLAMLAAGVTGYLLSLVLPVPGGTIILPMLVSCAMHLGGLSDAPASREGLAAAQVILGAAIGARFIGERADVILRAFPMALLCVLLTAAVSVAMGWQLARLTGREVFSTMLALAPGGMPEMSLIAVTLGLDAAFVTAMHLGRVLVVLVTGPLVWRLIRPR